MGIFDSLKKVWSQDMAIDLGTANTSCGKRQRSSS